jgi:hypothetical protein
LTMSTQDIENYVDQLEKESIDVREQCLKMSWYMRGGASYEDVLQMSHTERTLVSALIKENLDTTNKSRMPFF